jgi:transketolase
VSVRSKAVARETRRLVVEAAIRARTCHIGSSLSIVDILAVLYADVLRDESGRPAGRFLLSKGHAASALYGTLVVEGVLSLETMLTGYCSDGGELAGHPERGVAGIEMTGGSLGHGPAIAVGIALAERHAADDRPRGTYCLVGDGELGEGSVWEALGLAGQLGLDRLTVIVDDNGLQGLGPTADVLGAAPLAPKLEAFGFAVSEVDGHDHGALAAAFGRDTAAEGRPHAVIAHTIKGYGIASMEGDVMSHYRTLREEDRSTVLAGLGRI